jgi:hypothetical protein
MADDVYKLAIDKACRLRGELERLESFIQTYEDLASSRQPLPRAAAPNTDVHPTDIPCELPFGDAEKVEEPRRRGVPQEELERIATRILMENGSPLQRQALFEKVKATGIAIGGRDEMSNFGSKISRSDKFVNLPKRGYWPVDKACEAAGYFPQAAT